MPEFRITYDKGKISISSTSSRYDTSEEIVLRLGCYLIDKGKTEEMKSILAILNEKLEGGE